MRDAGGTVAQPRIAVSFPNGRELTFLKPADGSSVWYCTLPSRIERLKVTATDYTLITGELSQYRFVKRLNSSGASFYRFESYSDAEANTYTVGYASITDTLMRQVTDPSGRWIKLFYNDMGTSTNAVTPITTTALSSANINNWLDIPITPGTAYRYLALNQGNTWQQQNTLPVGELEFYDENNVKITGGTPFGSTPLFSPTTIPANAFDGNLSSVYRYAYVKAGFVGIDLGPGIAKKVSKIRLYITGLGSTSSVSFAGFNADPVPNNVISHIEGSDGRTVSYNYSTFSDTSGWFQWAQLTGANYPDGTASSYTYSQLHDYTAPIIQSLNDPRFEGTAKSVNYELAITTTLGFVLREFDTATGQEIGKIGWNSGHDPKIVFPNGRINLFHYSTGRITEKVDSFGFKSTYTYTGGNTGFLSSATDPLGRTTSYTLSGGRLASTTYPDGLVVSITRSSTGHVMSTNRGGEVTSHLRDTANRITRTNHPDGSYETWTYNTFGQKLTHRLRNGATESWAYTNGLKTSHTNSLGKVTTYTYDALGRLASFTDPLGNTTAYQYNDRGDITQTTYPDGGVEINSYDLVGNLIARQDTAGELWLYEYDSHSRRTKQTDPLNRVTIWNFGASGSGCGSCNTSSSPYSITHPDGSVTAYTYDKEWRLLTETRASGTALAATTTHTYDGAGQRLTTTDPLGRVTSYTYDALGRVATMTDPLGGVTSRTYDVKGNLLTETAPDGVVTSRTYGVMGRLLTETRASGTSIAQTTTLAYGSSGRSSSMTDPLNRVTTFTYDALDRNTKVTLPDGNFTQQAYDDAGRMTSSRDLGGHVTTYTHDVMGRVLTSTDATGVTISRTYDFLGRVLTVTTPTGKYATTTYDAVGNVLATTIAPGTSLAAVTSTTFDAMNRPLTRTDGEGSVTTMTHDVLGRMISVRDQLNHVTTHTYDVVGNLLSIRASDGIFTSTRTYDALNRPLTDKDGANRTITSAYDAVGRKTSYTDAKGATFSFQFDALGRLTRRTEPDTTYQTYTYDAANRLLVHRKADNATKTHAYGNPNRDFLTQITYSNGETPRTFTYNADGQMLTASNAHAALTWTYDAAHRQLSETQTLSGLSGSHVFSYLYDVDGNLSRHTRPDGSYVDYAWNARNLLASVTSDAPPPLATYTYNGRNQIASHVVESGLFTATRSYDTAGRLTGVSNGALDSTSYTLSPDGRRTGIDRNGSAETYGYDNARQVTSAALPLTGGTTNQSWNYDAAGNRSTATTNGATTSYTASSVNAYTAISGGGFSPPNPTYDANGNLLTGTVLPLGSSSLTSCVFTWDINNQLISATAGTGSPSGPSSATYQYDALGRRTQRTETLGSVTTTTWFLTNGWNVELEYQGGMGGSPVLSTRITWGLDLSGRLQGAGGVGGLVMVETLPSGGGSPVPSFPTYDGNGNITAWVNASGSVIARQRYDAYGNLIEQTGTPPSNYGFSTKSREKVTGFHYYGYRFYDALTGRWPSRDPIEEEGGINMYGLVGNDGLNQVDFLGLSDANEYPCFCDSDLGRFKNLSFTLTNETMVQRYEIKDPNDTIKSFIKGKMIDLAQKKIDALAGDSIWVDIKSKMGTVTSSIDKYSKILSIAHEVGTGMTVTSIIMDVSFDLCTKDKEGKFNYVAETAYGQWTDTTGLSIADESQRKQLPGAYKDAMLMAAEDMVNKINKAGK